jgi:RimJ/RimL family protein N-acetyltransferase
VTDELITARLRLRRWRPDDLGALTALFAEPSFSWHPFRRARSPEEAARFLEGVRDHWERHGFGRWAVCARSDGRLLGYAGPAASSWPPVPRGWDIGWRLAARARGRGLGGEAAGAAVADCLDRGVRPLVAVVESGNDASLRMCHRLGMRELDTRTHPAFGTAHTVFVLADDRPLRRRDAK